MLKASYPTPTPPAHNPNGAAGALSRRKRATLHQRKDKYLPLIEVDPKMQESVDSILRRANDRLEELVNDQRVRSAFLEKFEQDLKSLPIFRSGGARVSYNDPVDGYKVRRDRHRHEFRRVKGRRPIPYSEEDYTVVDFLREVWGDVILRNAVSSSVIIEHDFPLYRALNDYVRGVRNGTFYREADPSMTLARLLDPAADAALSA